MTLETAKHIVSDQGDQASEEARAVARGGMTICERTSDGRRIYPWIKVLPTETDGESSVEKALEQWRTRKLVADHQRPSNYESSLPPKSPTPDATPLKEESPAAIKGPITISQYLNNAKQKILNFLLKLDDCALLIH